MAENSGSLEAFHPVVRAWFARRFPEGPTPPQAGGWPAIRARRDTLIAAPTGSGKTLSAFLVCIDELYRRHTAGELHDDITVVYVSPLKALGVDIQQNLERPLAEIAEVAQELGLTPPEIRVAVRSGDTTGSGRAHILKKPPHILITTPESLYLMLTAEKSRELLRGVETVIVDEIHALARDRRGSHLALSLERLEHVSRVRPVRVGLSATQRPVERIAQLLVGAARTLPNGAPDCTIIDSGHRRALDLALELPDSELEAVASAEQVAEVLNKIAGLVRSRRTTLVFVNTRRLSERLAHQLAEVLGEDQVAAHHGSLSKERRLNIEGRLRRGELRALVATASLELGIDIGPVELVCQIGSPRSIATFLQRVGRSGHSRFGTPMGRLYPLTRDELVECTAVLRAVNAGRLDAVVMPEVPLDILAQQVVAECAAEEWDEEQLFGLVRRATPFSALTHEDFQAVVELVSEGVVTGRGKRAAYLQRDRVNARLKGRRGARLAALTSGGAIPETADYRVILDPDETFVGTVNEDFAIESMAGDVFLLGSTSWRIRRVERGTVRVVDAQGATPTIPFWIGEAPARTSELSEEVSAVRRSVDAELVKGGISAARALLEQEAGLGEAAARDLAEYLAASRAALGLLPSSTDIVFERFFDDTGGMQLVVHAPFGGRINRGLGLLLRKRFCRSFDFELQAAASDDAIVLSLGPQHSFPLEDMRAFLRPQGLREALIQAVLPTPIFGVRWRWNLNRALVVLRFRGGRKNPPQLQRMESDDVMAAIFPALTACQDNGGGPREVPDHVIVRQTLHDCLHEALDVDGLERLLGEIAAGTVRVHMRDTTEPSPLAHEILNSRPYTFLDDAPLEERRTRAVQLRRGLPVEARELAELSPEAIDRVAAEAAPEPRDPDELWDALSALVVARPLETHREWFRELERTGRAFAFGVAGGVLWGVTENLRRVEALYPEARFATRVELPRALAALPRPEPELAAKELVRGHLDTRGPSTVTALVEATLLSPGVVKTALAALEGEGFAVRGRFDARIPEEQHLARRLLARIHAYTLAALRREIEPVSAQDFMRFLLRFQHVGPELRLEGKRGVLAVVEQLQGFEASIAVWEREILGARVREYKPEWLDALCFAGDVVWGRLSPRQPSSDGLRGSTLSRATPVTLALRGDLPWLLAAARGDAVPPEPIQDGAQKVLALLRTRGALFASELASETGLLPIQVEEALWDAVARGLVTSDGFQPVRALLSPNTRWSSRVHPRRGALRRGARGHDFASEGRWSLLPSARALLEADALAEAVAEQLLARWGVVVRDLAVRETLALPWREITWALRRLEARGIVRGGRFVSGFVGEQYALPEAVDLLRKVRRTERSGEVIRVSACDPLNLVGTIVPGPRVPAVRTNFVTYKDGLPVAGADAPAARALRN